MEKIENIYTGFKSAVVNTYNAVINFVTKIKYIRIFVGLLFTFLSMLFSLPVRYFGKLLMLFNVMKTIDSLGGMTGNGKRDDEKVKFVHKLWIIYSILNLVNYVTTTYFENYIGDYPTNLFIMFVYYGMLNNSANLVGGCIDFSTRFYAVNIVIMNRYIELISGGCKFALNTTSDVGCLCTNVLAQVKNIGFSCGCYEKIFTCIRFVGGLYNSFIDKLKNMRRKERPVVSVNKNTLVAIFETESNSNESTVNSNLQTDTLTENSDPIPKSNILTENGDVCVETDIDLSVKQSDEVVLENGSNLNLHLETHYVNSPKLISELEYVTYEDDLDETF
jgi:hypothetical protein